MAAETVDEEKAENVTEELAETEIVTVKMAETKEVVKRIRGRAKIAKSCSKWALKATMG